ncbi:MAG: RNA 2',3'-cyclic phosphodiesterase [Bacteroidales bacterium]
MRTFAAIEIPLKIEQYAQLDVIKQSMANESIKWVDWSGLHLTLFFFGESSSVFIDKFNEFLQGLTSDFFSFDLRIKGLGVFGPNDNPKVLWLGIEPNATVNLLQEKVSLFAAQNGFHAKVDGFNPHITLARIKGISNINCFMQNLESYSDKVSWQLHIDKVTLYKSEINPKGSRYTPVFLHSLKR